MRQNSQQKSLNLFSTKQTLQFYGPGWVWARIYVGVTSTGWVMGLLWWVWVSPSHKNVHLWQEAQSQKCYTVSFNLPWGNDMRIQTHQLILPYFTDNS